MLSANFCPFCKGRGYCIDEDDDGYDSEMDSSLSVIDEVCDCNGTGRQSLWKLSRMYRSRLTLQVFYVLNGRHSTWQDAIENSPSFRHSVRNGKAR